MIESLWPEDPDSPFEAAFKAAAGQQQITLVVFVSPDGTESDPVPVSELIRRGAEPHARSSPRSLPVPGQNEDGTWPKVLIGIDPDAV